MVTDAFPEVVDAIPLVKNKQDRWLAENKMAVGGNILPILQDHFDEQFQEEDVGVVIATGAAARVVMEIRVRRSDERLE